MKPLPGEIWVHLGRWSVHAYPHWNTHLGWWKTGSGLQKNGMAYGCPWFTIEFLKRWDYLPSKWGVARSGR